MFVLLLLCLGSGVHAQKRSLPALARKQADSLARKQVIYNDRVVPFNTLARDFCTETDGKIVLWRHDAGAGDWRMASASGGLAE